jgi:hypothetical protein
MEDKIKDGLDRNMLPNSRIFLYLRNLSPNKYNHEMANLSYEELLEKVTEFESIIRDQQTLIQQLIEHNKTLSEIVTTQKEVIVSMKTVMGGRDLPPQH